MIIFFMITKCFLLLSPTEGHAHKYTHTEKHTGDDDERMIASSCNTHFSAISIDTLFCVTFGPTNKNVIQDEERSRRAHPVNAPTVVLTVSDVHRSRNLKKRKKTKQRRRA